MSDRPLSPHRAAIAVSCAGLTVALLLVCGALYLRSLSLTQVAADHALGEAAATVGHLYATARTRVALSAQRLAADRGLAAPVVDPDQVARRFTQMLDDASGFAVLYDKTGQVIASASGADQSDAATVFANVPFTTTTAEGYQLVSLDGQVYGVAVATTAHPGRQVAYGMPLQHALGAVWSGNVRVELALSDAVTAGVRQAPDPHSVSIVLDQAGQDALLATLRLSAEVATQWHRSLMWVVWLAAVLTLLLIGTLMTVLIRAAVLRQWHKQLAPVAAAVERAREGSYNQLMQVPADSPLSSLARQINAMFEQLDDRENRFAHHTQFDALTGLTNRSVVNERIDRAVEKARETGRSVAAVAVDVSRFNEVNGALGHEVGDQILKELARRLASNTRVTDTVARVGGDEFLLLLDDADPELSRHLVEFLVASLEEPIRVDDHVVKLKLQTGIALFPDHCESRQALRRMSNIALMTAKERQLKVVMYEPGQDERHLRELAIIHDLPSALRDNELYLQYQPKIDMETKRVTQVEALVRWRHPQLGFIPPDEFIGLLENAGQISQLTDWVFKEAVRQCREWMDAGYDLGIAVNISAQDLQDENLPTRIDALLRHFAVKPARISIEVTESAVIRDPQRAVAILQAFRRAGLKIALDDFGTGQTSLSLLKQLPLSQIKIDKSFVQTLRADSGDAIIVKSIIDLGHNMGLLVTAEGVESNYCWNLLNSYQCDLVQGYLISAPLTADELREWYLRLEERHVHKLDYSFIQSAGQA